MKTSMQELLDEVISEREKSISVEFREALDFVITAIKKDYKEIEKQQQGYSKEDMIRFANLYSDININESHLKYFNNLPKFKNK